MKPHTIKIPNVPMDPKTVRELFLKKPVRFGTLSPKLDGFEIEFPVALEALSANRLDFEDPNGYKVDMELRAVRKVELVLESHA